jgi:uncharacterized protein (DUF2225 family)
VERDFTESAEPSEGLREFVWTSLAPTLEREVLSGSLKYEHAAKVAEWQGSEPRYLADLYLRAAWCAVDEMDSEAERFFRRKAAWRFAEALEMFGGVPADERAVLTYLVGELWRRIGDNAQAAPWFAKVPGEITDETAQGWVIAAADQQLRQPREWFA